MEGQPEDTSCSGGESSPSKRKQPPESPTRSAPATPLTSPSRPCKYGPTSSIKEIRVASAFLKNDKKKPTKKQKGSAGDSFSPDNQWFSATYSIFIDKGDGSTKRINVNSNRECWDSPDPSQSMMLRVRDVIERQVDTINLDLAAGAGPLYMDMESPWTYMWAHAEKLVEGIKRTSLSKSDNAKRGHRAKTDAILEKVWEQGNDFKDRAEKHRAKTQVLTVLEKATCKEISKVEAVLSSIISDLSKNDGLEESALYSNEKKSRARVLETLAARATSFLVTVGRTPTLRTCRLLTGFCAIVAPPSNAEEASKAFCNLFGINSCNQYYIRGLENRAQYDSISALSSAPSVGDSVSCRGGDDGVLVKEVPGRSVTIRLLPYGNEVTYKSAKSAHLSRRVPALDEYMRISRSDQTPMAVITTIDSFFRRHVAISPNKKDIANKRHPDFPSQVLKKQAMLRYETFDELWAKFRQEHADIAVRYTYEKRPNQCPKILRDHAPWEMIKAYDSSCLCIDCEGMNCLRRGISGAMSIIDDVLKRVNDSPQVHRGPGARDLQRLTAIKDILSQPSKYDMIVSCLMPCLTSGKLEDAKYACLDNNECAQCGFRRLWTHGLKRSLFIYEPGTDVGSSNATLNARAPLAGSEWMEPKVDWRHYTYTTKPTVASHAQDVARQAASARAASTESIDANDDDYVPSNASSARNLCLSTMRGTLIDFLDEFESRSEKHAKHRNLVATERRSQIDWDRNVRPLVVKRDIDFSENGSIKDKHQVQSQHWVTIQYTLFVSINSWLKVSEWNQSSGLLCVGDEVTVNGELAGEPVNVQSFWGTVIELLDEDEYKISDRGGVHHVVSRSTLRHRVRHSVAFGHVSDDKVHDRHAMQHFTKHELKKLEAYMIEYYPEDIPGGRIRRLHQHSDNAGQHFKNTGAINYFTTLINERGGPINTAYVYTFGAPGHGKGPYDGIGGRWKRKIDQSVASAMTKGVLSYTRSGYIESVDDVYDALVYHFGPESSQHRNQQLAGKNPIHRYEFFLYTHTHHPIERPIEIFDTLKGIFSHYQYAVNNDAMVYMRRRSCWCIYCMRDLFAGTLNWHSGHCVLGCSSAVGGNVATESNVSENVYTFSKRDCYKTSGPGVTRIMASERRDRSERSMQLCVNDWVIFDSEDEGQPLWLGRVMSNPEWGGQGVYRNSSNRIKNYEGVSIGKNEVAIFVMWYDKIDLASSMQDYYVSRTITKAIVQNNRYFVYGGFEMHRLLGGSNPAPKFRSGARVDDIDKRSDEWHDREYGLVWRMDERVRSEALSRCSVWME